MGRDNMRIPAMKAHLMFLMPPGKSNGDYRVWLGLDRALSGIACERQQLHCDVAHIASFWDDLFAINL
tara:strand:+ start:210 stop:413 length:204 start_codon:yes stop_codon:yes gene_type:complete